MTHFCWSASRRTEKAYLKTFLSFLNKLNNSSDDSELQPEIIHIEAIHLTDEICAKYISAVPHITCATIRGNCSHIFHTAFVKNGLKPMKQEPEKYIKTLQTLKGIKSSIRWKVHKPLKAGIFTEAQYCFIKNSLETDAKIDTAKLITILI